MKMRLASAFRCPNCGSERGLAEVIHVFQYYPISGVRLVVDADGEGQDRDKLIRDAIKDGDFEVDFSSPVCDEAQTDQSPLIGYMCVDCGVRIEAQALKEAVQWLYDNGYLVLESEA